MSLFKGLKIHSTIMAIVEAYTVEQRKHIATTVELPLPAANCPTRLAISKQRDSTETAAR